MIWKSLAISCSLATAATGVYAGTFLAGYVEDAKGIGIGGATVVLDQAGTKLEELRTAPDGWFESGDLGRDLAPTRVNVAVLKEGFEFLRVVVRLDRARNFVPHLRLQRLEGVLSEEKADGGGFLLIHGQVDDEVDQTPIVGASVAVRIGEHQVGFAYSNENGYFSIPLDWKYRDSIAEVRVDHSLHSVATLMHGKLAPNLPPVPALLAPSSGLRFFVSYPEVLKGAYSDFHLRNVVFGRNPGFTNVLAGIRTPTVPAILEANSWKVELPDLKPEQAHELTFQFQLAVRNLPKIERERVLRRVREVAAKRQSSPEAATGDLRRQIDAVLGEELDGFLGVLETTLRRTLDERRVSPLLEAALRKLGAAVPAGSLINVAERSRSWHVACGGNENLFIIETERALAVFRDAGGTELRISSVGESPSNDQILDRLAQGSSGPDDIELAVLGLEMVQRVVRRPPAADRQRFGLGFGYAMFFPSGEQRQFASLGLGYEAVLSTFPFIRWRSALEKYSTMDLRSNLSIDLGVGIGTINRSVPNGGNISEKGFLLSLGAGYYLSDNIFVSLGAFRQESPPLEGAYLALGLGFKQF